MQLMKVFMAALALLVAVPAVAQVQQAKGKATESYTSKKLTQDVKDRAVRSAQLKAIEIYFAEAGEAETANFAAAADRIAGNLDKFVLDSTILSEQDDPSAKRYTVAVRIDLNVAALRNELKAGSAVAQTARSQRSALAFVFVARQTASKTTYQDRVYARQDASVKGTATEELAVKGSMRQSARVDTVEGESISASTIKTTDSVDARESIDGKVAARSAVDVKVTATTETGGSTTRKASDASYRVFSSSDVNSVFTETFTGAGFRAREGAYLEGPSGGLFKVADVEADYSKGNDLRAATQQNIATGLKRAGVPYIAFGTLDVGLTDTNPQTGLPRVTVKVTAKVLDVSQAIPEVLVSAPPAQFSGEGPDEETAQGNAMKLAAKSIARELASRLNELGIY